jgi:hypothetical protein
MLLTGNATLCLVDASDAAIRSDGNWVQLLMRLNLIAWYQMIQLSWRELCIRLGIESKVEKQLNAYQRINEALTGYMAELSATNKEDFEREAAKYEKFAKDISAADTEESLHALLLDECRAINMEPPWGDDIDAFMTNKNSVLTYK